MLKKIIATTVLGLAMSGVALAGHCPKDAKAITAGLANSNLSAAAKAEVEALRDKGMAQHNAGDHGAAEATLAEGMRKVLMGGM